jgi:hypothetical protein
MWEWSLGRRCQIHVKARTLDTECFNDSVGALE